MPEISRFFGVVITMYYDDHLPPHFHARYSGFRAVVAIEHPRLLSGKLPPRVMGFVVEWVSRHHAELLEDWNLARRRVPLNPIEPLQ